MRHPFASADGSVFVPGAGRFVRAIEQGDTTVNFAQGISIPITALVKGKPKSTMLLGNSLFRPVGVPWNFSYMTFGLENRVRKDTRRAMRAKFEKSERRLDTIASKLERFGWAAMLDRDEIGIANEAASALGNSLNVQAAHAALARDIVELDLEYRRSVIALAAASYASTPDMDTTLGAGSEFNGTSGDSRVAIRAAAATLGAANGIQPDQIKVWLTDASYQAAMDDPELNTRLAASGALNVVGSQQLQQYWGVGAVQVGDAYYSTDGSSLVSMYGDVAILTVNRPLAGYDEREGQLDSFVRFNWQGGSGVASQPFYDNDRTTWIFPWEAWEKAAQVNTTAAAIIRNTKA